MRQLAMRFRGIPRSGELDKRDQWLHEAHQFGLQAIQRFARTVSHDLAAVRNASTERWSNGPVEGQINRLKTLRAAMYGRAGLELLRARLLPFSQRNSIASDEDPRFTCHDASKTGCFCPAVSVVVAETRRQTFAASPYKHSLVCII